MKTLFVCGDSFCTSDSEHGPNWIDQLSKRYPALKIINLSTVGASNYLIYLQVKHALLQDCDYLIYNATSSIRQEFALREDHAAIDDYSRYLDIRSNNDRAAMISTSLLTPDRYWKNKFKSDLVKQFFKECCDLPNLIEKNYIYIMHTLNLIETSKITWAWSQGGFEHKMFSTNSNWDFSAYKAQESKINLWDHYDSKQPRPYYHIEDQKILASVCEEYAGILQL